MQKYFPQNLRFLRKKNNLTQLELANYLGKTKGLISCYEKGVAEPGMAILIKLSKKLGVNLHDLCTKDLSREEIPKMLNGEVNSNTVAKFRLRWEDLKKKERETSQNLLYEETRAFTEDLIHYITMMDKKMNDASNNLEHLLDSLKG